MGCRCIKLLREIPWFKGGGYEGGYQRQREWDTAPTDRIGHSDFQHPLLTYAISTSSIQMTNHWSKYSKMQQSPHIRLRCNPLVEEIQPEGAGFVGINGLQFLRGQDGDALIIRHQPKQLLPVGLQCGH